MRINPKAKRRAGFAMIEALLALSLSVMLLAMIATVVGAFRVALTQSGAETLAGRVVALNPDDTVTSLAHVLGAEMTSVASQARFAVVAGQPWAPLDASNTVDVECLRSLTPATAADPLAVLSLMKTAGRIFDPQQGYTVFLVGPNLRLAGAVVVSQQGADAPNGDGFVVFIARMYGDYANGWGLIYEYEFASPVSSTQALPTPSVSSGAWQLLLPDPGAPTSRPDGSAHPNPESYLFYEIPSHF